MSRSSLLVASIFLLFVLVNGHGCFAQMEVGTCAAFSQDGTLAIGMVRNGSLETKLDTPRSSVVTVTESLDNQFSYGRPRHCEEAFSSDGKWLATVIPSNRLTIVIFDRKTSKVHKTFSSAWFQLDSNPLEWAYSSRFLAAFKDDSVFLWRYVPRAVADKTDGSNADLHLQRWSVDGQLISDQNLGALGSGPGERSPIDSDGLSNILVPGFCDSVCYKRISASSSQVTLESIVSMPKDNAAEPNLVPKRDEILTVVGRTAQKAVLLDSAGESKAHVSLPFVPNLARLVVPDWFFDHQPAISNDGEFAAVARTRVAWILVDTDRDWGSEIVLLKLHPLFILTKVKVGKVGGIQNIALDHRNGSLRLVGFWKGKWHEVECDEQHPGNCKNQALPF